CHGADQAEVAVLDLAGSHGHRYPRSFPTRRSSDLSLRILRAPLNLIGNSVSQVYYGEAPRLAESDPRALLALFQMTSRRLLFLRSEEHTSELQSRENLVCRLLLAKEHTTAA